MSHDLVEEVALQIALGSAVAWWPEGMVPMDMRVEVEPWHREIASSVLALIEQQQGGIA